jgi:hypothetical protein
MFLLFWPFNSLQKEASGKDGGGGSVILRRLRGGIGGGHRQVDADKEVSGLSDGSGTANEMKSSPSPPPLSPARSVSFAALVAASAEDNDVVGESSSPHAGETSYQAKRKQ